MKEDTSLTSVLLFAVAALLGAVGQYLYKSGAEATDENWLSYVFNVRLAIGVVLYVVVMVLFVSAFKLGGSLTVLYPIYASTFIWAAFISRYVYGTSISLTNMFGMTLLILGMYFLGK